MATADDYAAWIIKNQAKKGSPEFATVAAAYEEAKREESAPKTKAEGPSFGDRLKGIGEAALSTVTAPVGLAAGGLNALNAIGGNVAKFATGRTDYQDVSQAFEQPMQALTYAPRTETGQAILKTAADATAPLPGLGGELSAIARATQLARPAAQATAQAVKPAAAQAVEAVKAKIPNAPAAFGKSTAGAAETPQALQRRVTAEGLPVPFEGESALTKGQAGRDFAQLQFEKETAKQGDLGAPIRNRQANQTATLLQNWDALVDQANPITLDSRSIGKGVSQAVVNKSNVKKAEIRKLYEQADELGETAQPIETPSLVAFLNDAVPDVATAPVIDTAIKRALRLGIATQDESGSLIPQAAPLRNVEAFRKAMNQLYDPAQAPNAAKIQQMKRLVDEATEGAGGDVYKQARAARAKYAREFENVGLTSKLLDTKRGTDERAIAYSAVFDKIILDSPLEEMNKVRRTLIGAGPQGKQAWQDMKAKTIDHIKEQATKGVQMDERGQPTVSLHQMNRTISALDQEGKLEALFGKKQAQQIRDLNEIAKVIYTAPPGSVNFSNTASALQVALDAIGTGTLTGLPIPAVTAIKEGTKYLKNRKTAARINEALNAGARP